MKIILIPLCIFLLVASDAIANIEKPIDVFNRFKIAKHPVRFKLWGSSLKYNRIRLDKRIDSARIFYLQEILNSGNKYIDYLPLTAGSAYPLSGTLYGSDAIFSGNVNIGMSTLSYKLSVINTGNNGSWALLGGAFVAGENNGSYPSFGYNISGTGGSTFNYASSDYASWVKFDQGKIVFNVASSGSAGTTIAPTAATTILRNGNVGIGMSAPLYKLSVINTGNNGSWAQLGGAFVAGENNGSYPSFGYNISGTGSSSFNYAVSDYASWIKFDLGKIVFNVSSAGTGGTTISPTVATTILANGNVGIGIASPTERLSVEGNISANGHITTKKLIVTQTGWSDYVFAIDYKLRSLSSLETFIKQNKHLPEMPSAKEVEEKGISVGDNQALLLKKIEELTLYVIELKKENTKQQEQINLLNKINKL